MSDLDDIKKALADSNASLATVNKSVSNIAADQAALLSRINIVIPVYVQLFGPIAGNGLTQTPVGLGQWEWIGAAMSASTKLFAFNLGYPHAASVRWVVIWTPNSTQTWMRLVAFDYADPSLVNPVELGVIKSIGRPSPTPEVTDITAQFNALVDAKKQRQIGFQIVCDTDVTFYEVRLEINWAV